MADHVCEFRDTIKRIDRELFGNGNKGIVKEFIELKTEHNDMKNDLQTLARSYSALVKSREALDVIEKQKVENRKRFNEVLQRLGLTATIVGGLVTLAYFILEHIG